MGGDALKSLGLVCCDMGEPSQALLYLERNLAIYERIMGEDAAAIATTLNNIGIAHFALGHEAQAVTNFERSLEVLLKAGDKEHPEVANIMHYLGSVHHRMGRFEDAAVLYDDSLKLAVRIFGVENPLVISLLADTAILALAGDDREMSVRTFVALFQSLRPYCTRQFCGLSSSASLKMIERFSFYSEAFHSICSNPASNRSTNAQKAGAQQLALNKSLLEEAHATEASLQTDSQASTRELRAQLDAIQDQLTYSDRNDSV